MSLHKRSKEYLYNIKKKLTRKINRRLNCGIYNIIYLIECKKDNYRQHYIGKSKRPLGNHFADNRGYVVNQHVDTATGAHFTLPGHSVSDMTVTILEQSKYNNESYRKEEETYFINKLNTFHSGLNKKM